MRNSGLYKFALALVVIGGLNWGLAVFNFNLVNWLAVDLLSQLWLAKVVYALVGLSALVVLGGMFSDDKPRM